VDFSFILGIGNGFVFGDFFLFQRWGHTMIAGIVATICVGLMRATLCAKWRRIAKDKHCCNSLETQKQIAKKQE
jgi:hypothetical protein